MPTVITHGVLGATIGKAYAGKGFTFKLCVYSVVCSMIPDLDVIAFPLDIPYEHFLGHRGFSHSPFFTLLLGLFISTFGFRENRIFSRKWLTLSLCFASINVVHGILDAMTDGGLGVAFFSPFSNERYFLPFTPIPVSPIGLYHFITSRGLSMMLFEALWLWLPAAVLCKLILFVKRKIFKEE